LLTNERGGPKLRVRALPSPFIRVVNDDEHSDGAPTPEGTGIRVVDIAKAYEHSGYDPDVTVYPDLSLGDVHTALAYYYEHVDELRKQTV
jgi:Protein of unknown function (DUF433).